MKLNKMGRIAKAAVFSLALGLGLTACSRDYTLAYVYVTSTRSNPGLIDAYSVDFQSGALLQLADSPIPAGRNPVGLVTATDTATSNQFIFVLNHDDSTIGSYGIGTDGKLYPENTYNTTGSFPVAATVSPDGKFLYVAYTFQTGFTTTSPGPGGISIFPITYQGSGGSETVKLGTPSNVNIGNNPVAITTSQLNNFLYVVDAETPATTSPVGEILGFKRNTDGSLTALPGQAAITGTTGGIKQYAAGVSPSAIAINPLSKYVYVTDKLANQLIGYTINTDGSLTPMVNGPFTTQQFPVAVTIDPRGLFLYVANFNSNSISAYALDKNTGTPANSVGGSIQVGTNPVCITIEPALGVYLYTPNQKDGTVSAQQLDPHNGTLKQIQNTPFPASGLPSCAVSVANGLHSTQLASSN